MREKEENVAKFHEDVGGCLNVLLLFVCLWGT